jgi:hypothetical protein
MITNTKRHSASVNEEEIGRGLNKCVGGERGAVLKLIACYVCTISYTRAASLQEIVCTVHELILSPCMTLRTDSCVVTCIQIPTDRNQLSHFFLSADAS